MFDQQLANRLRNVLKFAPDIQEQKMMGGLCFMAKGHMACGIHEAYLIVRVGADAYADVLKEPHVLPMQVGRMKPGGFVFVEPAGCNQAATLEHWVKRGLDFAASLPPKKPRSPATARRSNVKSAKHH